MNRTLQITLLLLGCAATSLAQSEIGSVAVSPKSSAPNPLTFYPGTQPTVIYSPNIIPADSLTNSLSGFQPAMVALDKIHLNGNNVVVDSFVPAIIPEPDSCLTLVVASALFAWFGLRRTTKYGSIGHSL